MSPWITDRAAPKDGVTCRIFEYDGAFQCYTHNRLWGAVTKPDEPCAAAPLASRAETNAATQSHTQEPESP